MHYKYKSKPFAHQKKALEMSWDKEVFAYFMEMGTGKSKVLIDNIAMLYNAGKINGALIVAPKGVYKRQNKGCKSFAFGSVFHKPTLFSI